MSAQDLQYSDRIIFDLRDCLGAALQVFKLRAGEKKQPLTCDVHPEVPAAVAGDPRRLRQLVELLVEPALENGSAGAVTVHLDLEAATAEAVWLHLSVSDRGPTPSAAWQQNLLEQLDGCIWWDRTAEQGNVVHVHIRFEVAGGGNPAIFDREATLDRVGRDGALLREAIDLFLLDCVAQLGQMRAALADGAAERLRRAGHGLKGQLLFFGAQTTVETLSRLHRCVAAQEVDRAAAEFTALEHQLHALQEQLRTFAAEATHARADR